jgi:hypothetical protein
MGTRRIVSRILIVALLAVIAFVVMVVVFTWGSGAGGSGVE